MPQLSPEQIEAANQMEWYHAIDFGEYQTSGRFAPPKPPNMTLFGVMELLNGIVVKGMCCLDVGAAHGLISLGLALRGAEVTAIDIGAGKSPQIRLAEEIFGVKINYRAPVSIEAAPSVLPKESFDLVVCAGVMYHLLNPADVFIRLRPLLKRNGLLVMESAYDPKTRDPVLILNSETGQFTEPTTYMLPSASAITGLAKLTCFDVLATRTCSPVRYALIGKAVPPEEVRERTEMCVKIHSFGLTDPAFSFAGFSAAPKSAIEYIGAGGHRLVGIDEIIDFPPHPKNMIVVLGKRVTGEKLRKFTSSSLSELG